MRSRKNEIRLRPVGAGTESDNEVSRHTCEAYSNTLTGGVARASPHTMQPPWVETREVARNTLRVVARPHRASWRLRRAINLIASPKWKEPGVRRSGDNNDA